MNLRTILFSQYPALFLLAVLFLIAHLRVRKTSAVKSVLWVILFGAALAASVVCCFLGIQAELWTLKTLITLGFWSWFGVGLVLLFLVLRVVHGVEKRSSRRRLDKAMKQAEKQKEEEVSRARAEGAAAERERDKFAESYSTASSAQDALKKGLTAAQETISELRAQIEEGAQKLASAKADCDRQLKAKEEAAEQRIAELEAQHAERLSAAEQERKRLLSELDELRPQVEEYGRVKAHIADIELSARERADALDAATRERLQAMIAACRGHCEQVLSTLGATCESVSNELKRADAAVAQLPEAFTTLVGQLDELKKLEQ